jgi:hypothetical protein
LPQPAEVHDAAGDDRAAEATDTFFRVPEMPVVVTSARQPAWTMMKMQLQWIGNWTVAVLNGKGQAIGQRNFAYHPPM